MMNQRMLIKSKKVNRKKKVNKKKKVNRKKKVKQKQNSNKIKIRKNHLRTKMMIRK